MCTSGSTIMIGIGLFLAAVPKTPLSQIVNSRFDTWPAETSIHGNVILVTSPDDLPALKRILPRTAKHARVQLYSEEGISSKTLTQLRALFQQNEPQHSSWSTSTNHASTLTDIAKECDVLCWHSSGIFAGAHLTALHECRDVLKSFVNQNKTLVLIGPVSQMAGHLNLLATGETIAGLDLIPDAILCGEFHNTPLQRSTLFRLLKDTTRTVGIGLPPHTAMILAGRKIQVAGSNSTTFFLHEAGGHPEHTKVLVEYESQRQSPNEYLLDWTQWRRRSIDRTLVPFPPVKRQVPFVENGTLVIVGGGRMPVGLMEQFIELAGGPYSSKMVYIPCEESSTVPPVQQTVQRWRKAGVQHASFIHTKDRSQANSDEQFLRPLREATGLWFGGGRQWNFSDSYYGTTAHKLMKNVLDRGGVVGGSSAGASIQAEYLARATPIQNFDIMAPGYERGGLGFLPGVAIDQHFSQRGRLKDMAKLVRRYPQLLGIGIDEETAIIVRKSTATVVGRGHVFFYDHSQQTSSGGTDYVSLPAGSSYNLATRRAMIDTNKPELEPSVDLKD